MPRRASKPCVEPGCKNLVSERNKRYCDEHKPTNFSGSKKGYGNRWRKERKTWLLKHPFCAECLRTKNKQPIATVVDHIIPHKGNEELFWDKSNWQSLCISCHNRKTAKEDMGSWYR